MNPQKKKFIDKLKKKQKNELIELVCDLYEHQFMMEKHIKHLKALCFSHQQVLRSVLNNQHPTLIFEGDDDEPEDIIPEEKESLRSYV